MLGQRTGRPVDLNVGRQVKRVEISWTLRHAENVTSIHFIPLLLPPKSFSAHQQLCPTLGFTGLKPTKIVHCRLDLSTSITIKTHLQNEYYVFFHSRLQQSGLMLSENSIFSPLLAHRNNAGNLFPAKTDLILYLNGKKRKDGVTLERYQRLTSQRDEIQDREV